MENNIHCTLNYSRGKQGSIGMFLLYLSFVIMRGQALSQYSTPDYRSTSSLPTCLMAPSTCTDILAYTLLQPAWILLGSAATLPFVFNGSTGISISFTVINPGFYALHITVDRTSRGEVYLDTYFYNSTSSSQKADVNFVSTMMMGKQWFAAGSYDIYVWGDNLLTVTSLQIVKIEPVKVELTHSPYYSMLFLITNITTSSISNKSLILSGTSAALRYKTPITYECNNSILTPTNPADFANYTYYSYVTNLQGLSPSYAYAIANDNSTMLGYGNISTATNSTYLVLAVSNILVDCTVDVTANIGGGLVLSASGTFPVVFQPIINQSVTYVETVINVPVNVTNQIFDTRFTVVTRYFASSNFSYILADSSGFNSYPFSFFVIDGYNTTFSYTSQYLLQAQFTYIKTDQTTPINSASVFTMNMPDRYLRNVLDRSLHSFTFLNLNTSIYLVSQVIRQHFNTSSNVTYYQKQMIMRVIYNITVKPCWSAFLTLNRTSIAINNVTIPDNNKTFINNTDNLVQVQIQLYQPLLYGSNITVGFNANWCDLQDVDGACLQWMFPTSTVNYSSAPTLFPPPVQQAIVQQISLITRFAFTSFQFTSYSKQSFQLFAFSYFISNFIAFQNLAFLYFFIPLKNTVNVYSKQVSDALFKISDTSNYLILIDKLFSITMDFRLVQNRTQTIDVVQTFSTQVSRLSYYDYGFHSDYVVNNLQNISTLLLTCLKVLIIKLLSFLPFQLLSSVFGQLLSLWKQLILTQIVLMTPNIFIVLGIYAMQNDGFSQTNFYQTVNIILTYVTGLLCILSVFGLMSTVVQESVNHNKNGKNNQVSTKYLFFLDNSLYFLIPFLSTCFSPFVFIPIITVFNIYRLYRLIKTRNSYACGSFTKELINKIIWLCFNLVFLMYWVVEIVPNYTNQSIENNDKLYFVAMVYDLASSLIFLSGCLLQLLTSAIYILYYFVKGIKYILCSADESVQNDENNSHRIIPQFINANFLKLKQMQNIHNSHQIQKIQPQLFKQIHLRPGISNRGHNLMKMRALYKQSKKYHKYMQNNIKCNSGTVTTKIL